jgi:PTS system nitrogen regulatory IIA component
MILSVPERLVFGWIQKGTIPVTEIDGQYWFTRADILEWATARGLPVSADIFSASTDGAEQLPRLSEALEAGGVHHGVGGVDRASVLRAVVARMTLPDDLDRDYLFEVLLSREALGSTGVGDGIAIPHVRNPLVVHVDQPTITLCFLANPVEFNAVDGRPVTTVFSLVSPTIRSHLHLLSRLSAALHDAGFRRAVTDRASCATILAQASRVEGGFAAPGAMRRARP